MEWGLWVLEGAERWGDEVGVGQTDGVKARGDEWRARGAESKGEGWGGAGGRETIIVLLLLPVPLLPVSWEGG